MKSQAGQVIKVKVTEVTEENYIFKDIKNNEYLIPKHRCHKKYIVNQFIKIYSFLNKEGKIDYSADLPILQTNEIGVLEVAAINRFGFFLNNNTQRDLLMPNSEKIGFIKENDFVLVKVYTNNEGLDRATMKINSHERMKTENEVQLTKRYQGRVVKKINSKASRKTDSILIRIESGLNVFIHHSEYDKEPRLNEFIEFRVIFIRDDLKVYGSLLPHVKDRLEYDQKKLLKFIYEENGVITLTEKSESKTITAKTGLSKKSFKKAIKALLDNKKIEFRNQKYYLVSK